MLLNVLRLGVILQMAEGVQGPFAKVAVVPSAPSIYFTQDDFMMKSSDRVGQGNTVRVDCGGGIVKTHNVVIVAENVWTLAEPVCVVGWTAMSGTTQCSESFIMCGVMKVIARV